MTTRRDGFSALRASRAPNIVDNMGRALGRLPAAAIRRRMIEPN